MNHSNPIIAITEQGNTTLSATPVGLTHVTNGELLESDHSYDSSNNLFESESEKVKGGIPNSNHLESIVEEPLRLPLIEINTADNPSAVSPKHTRE